MMDLRNGLSKYLLAISFAASCLFLGLLLSTVKPAVFFSGDGGLKYLVTQQISHHGSPAALQLNVEGRVNAIWDKGFYPFKPPFVYEQQGEKVVSFPPYFQWLSAPLLAWFGWWGLYVIPAVSLLITWLLFAQTLQRLAINKRIAAAALLGLSLCSPLTLYAAAYWEHTLAVLLLFAGIVFLVNPEGARTHALVSGCFTGLATWLRPEALLLWLLIVAMVLYNQTQQPKKNHLYFVAGSFVPVALFFICNWVLYKDFLGAHGYQLTGDTAFGARIQQSFLLLTHLNAKLLLYFPIAAIVYAMALLVVIRKQALPTSVGQLLIISILFSLIAPFFLPNGGGKQWGPRYFLFLIPIVLLAGTMLFNHFSYRKTILLWLLVPIMLYSLYQNCFSAYRTLHDDYAFRVKPCLEQLMQDSCNTVVVQNQFVAQEFAALFQTKKIFLAENAAQYTILQALLRDNGKREWIFLAHDRELVLSCPTQPSADSIQHSGDYFFVRCRR